MKVNSAPPHILLADDDPRSCALFSAFFERLGWRYEVVPDMQTVVSAVTSGDYDVVIADVTMPGIDPTRFLDDVRRQSPSQAIIALSDDASFENALSFFRSGAMGVIPRPVDFSWLEHIVTDVVHALRYDEGERKLYRNVASERTELCFSCRQLADSERISLPILTRLRECGMLSEASALRIKLAVQEAVMNGFEHGNLELSSAWKEEFQADGVDKFTAVRRERLQNPFYADRQVWVVSWLHDGTLEIVVKDDGSGFLPHDGEFQGGIRSPDELSCSGRGLALMSGAVDVVRFARKGAEVTLIKYLDSQKDT
jgi:CheY-like chemotaxis protein